MMNALGNNGAKNSGSVTSEGGDSELLELVVRVLGLVSELFVDSSDESLSHRFVSICERATVRRRTHLERSELDHGVCRQSQQIDERKVGRLDKQGICRPQSEGSDLKRL